MKKIFQSISASLFLVMWLLILSSCSDHHEEDVFKTIYPHTLLLYIAGDNNLSSYADRNIRDIGYGMLQNREGLNLLIYKDNNNGNPALFRLAPRKDRIDTLFIAHYEEQNSLDPAVMKDVINTAFANYDTEVKGFLMWGHGASWIPSPNYSNHQGKTSYQAPANFGPDTDDYLELWQFREVLEEVPHLSYMLFDACYSASAELAYCLRNVTDYILASPAEVPGDGFPYMMMPSQLSKLERANNQEIENILSLVANEYVEQYPNNAVITLINTASMDKLIDAYASIRQQNQDKLSALKNAGSETEALIEHYGRMSKGSRYDYYDIKSVVRFLTEATNNTTTNFYSILSETIPYYHYSNYSFTEVCLDQCCGLSVSLPELFQLTGKEEIYSAAYAETLWGQYMTQL